MMEFNISTEEYREYDFWCHDGGFYRVYKIDNPQKLFIRTEGSTHRILDSEGVVHCVPAPGHHGCVMRWSVRPGNPDVTF